jgi:hypothetical protein
LLEVYLCHILCRIAKSIVNYSVRMAKNTPLRSPSIHAWPSWLFEQAVARTSATFKQADLVRAVKAVRAAGLSVTATQIAPDGTIRLIHTESTARTSSDYDRFEAEL